MNSEIIIAPAFFVAFVYMIKVLSDNWVRKKLIEKGLVDENVKYLYSGTNQTQAALKWGMALIAIGAAILLGQLAPYDVREELTISGMFIFPGIALILYYFVARSFTKDAKE